MLNKKKTLQFFNKKSFLLLTKQFKIPIKIKILIFSMNCDKYKFLFFKSFFFFDFLHKYLQMFDFCTLIIFFSK